VVGGVVFALFDDVFALFFLVVGAFWVLAYNIVLTFWSSFRHIFRMCLAFSENMAFLACFKSEFKF
jgi:hypothetical protein